MAKLVLTAATSYCNLAPATRSCTPTPNASGGAQTTPIPSPTKSCCRCRPDGPSHDVRCATMRTALPPPRLLPLALPAEDAQRKHRPQPELQRRRSPRQGTRHHPVFLLQTARERSRHRAVPCRGGSAVPRRRGHRGAFSGTPRVSSEKPILKDPWGDCLDRIAAAGYCRHHRHLGGGVLMSELRRDPADWFWMPSKRDMIGLRDLPSGKPAAS